MLRNYLLTACKVFMRRKLFTAINLACIVITLVVLVVIAALLQTLFFPSAGVEGKSARFLQTMTIRMESGDGKQTNTSPLGYKVIDKYLKPMAGVERVAAETMPSGVSVYQGDRVSQLQLRHVDADYWKILDFELLAGRLPTAADDAGGHLVAVLNLTTARKLFGAAPAAIGRRIDVGGRNFDVIGVVADTLHFNSSSDIWVPIASMPTSGYRNSLNGMFVALILARDKGDLPRIRRDIERIARTIVTDDPATWKHVYIWGDSKLDLAARTLLSRDNQPDSGAATLLSVIGAAMLLFMLLPALNLVNLNTGRVLERQAEIGVRKAFGATNAQLVLQLVVENILLSLAGGLIAFAIAAAVLHWIEIAGPLASADVQMNFTVFGYGMLLAAVFGLVSGVLPAWKMARLDPVHALKGAV